MEFWLGVKNFAKIKSAKIRIDGFTVLVGPNNSGKTFLMQLAQGVGAKIYELLDENVMDCFFNSSNYKYQLSNENIHKIVDFINEKLYVEKEKIVKDIFKKDITIEELFISMNMKEEETYVINLNAQPKKLDVTPEIDKIIEYLDTKFNDKLVFSVINKRNLNTGKDSFISLNITDKPESDFNLLKSSLRYFFEPESLFLPASRTGLLLLYREFFANRTDNAMAYKVENNKVISNKESYGGFTQPVYEFLRFLQTYTENDNANQSYSEELKFFDENLIEGHINVNQQGAIFYQPNRESQTVPMYLASSMINEIAPIALALNGEEGYERLIIDEIEASLHPLKQQEMVRFLTRLNKKGMKLIVSTHSDTFVSKLNNLYILSNRITDANKEDILNKLNLDKRDLINKEQLFVYEFVPFENGRHAVKEIVGEPDHGYQFDMFTNSAMQLYDEAVQLGEL